MFTLKIRHILGIGVLSVVPFMKAGNFEAAAGLYPGGEAEKCYTELNGGKRATSEQDPLLRAVAENYLRLDTLSGDELLGELSKAGSEHKASIIRWILAKRGNSVPGQNQYPTDGAKNPVQSEPQRTEAVLPFNRPGVSHNPNSAMNPGSFGYAPSSFGMQPTSYPGTATWGSPCGVTGSPNTNPAMNPGNSGYVPSPFGMQPTSYPGTATWGSLYETTNPNGFGPAPTPNPSYGVPLGNLPQPGTMATGYSVPKQPDAFRGDPFAAKTPSPFEKPLIAETVPPAAPKHSAKSLPAAPQGSPDISAGSPSTEESPVVAVKIDVMDKKTIQIAFDDQVACKLIYDSGLWNIDTLKEEALDLLPLEPGASHASFEFGGVNFKIHLNGDIEVFGNTPVQHCVLECPKEGKLIIPSGKDLQVNRFVCLTRGKTIENYGRLAITEACFCFEQKIVNHGDIVSTSTGPNKGAILLLQSALTGGAVDVKVITLEDRSYPEYGCCCFYGFDRSLYPCRGAVCDWSVAACFLDYPLGKPHNYLWFHHGQYLPMPFSGHSAEKDYNIPFTGGAIVAFSGTGNGNPGLRKKQFQIRICDSLSGRILSRLSGEIEKEGISAVPINVLSRGKVSNRIKIFFQCPDFTIFEKSPVFKVVTPAIYFFKL